MTLPVDSPSLRFPAPRLARRALVKLVAFTCAAPALALAAPTTSVQAWPTKPIRLIVNFPPGSSPDVMARAIGTPLSQALGQPIVIENRTGASGMIGAEPVAKAPADGYTLLLTAGSTFTMVPHMMPKMSFDPVKDFVPVAGIGRIDIFLVTRSEQPFKSYRELIAHAKAKPDTLSYASAGNGTSPHVAGEMFKEHTGIVVTHVPYRGSTPALQDLLGGQVDYAFDSGASVAHIRSGKLRLLATAGAKRSPAFPDTPTLHELGLQGFDAGTTHGLLAPAGTPQPVVDRLNREVNRLLNTAELAQQLRAIGAEPAPGTPTEFRVSMERDSQRYAAIIKQRGIRPD